MIEGEAETALFLGRYGHRLSVRSVEKGVKGYGRLAGLRVTPHVLRHCFATHMMEGGAGLMQISDLLGHANVSTTQIYLSVTHVEARKSFMAYHPRSEESP